MKRILRLSLVLLAFAALFASSGCGPFWVDPYITVDDSPLNWIEIHYYNMVRKPYRRVAVRLTGAGSVELKKGTSELVSNDFAKRYQDPGWADCRTQRFMIDPQHAKDLMQNLVNYGVLDKEKTMRGSKAKTFDRFIAVKANIANTTYSEQENIYETDPELAEHLYDVIREFDNPLLR